MSKNAHVPSTGQGNRATISDSTETHFIAFSDSCVGVPERPEAARFDRVCLAVQKLDPAPEFIAFPGDAVMDGSRPEQWQQWFEQMAWAAERGLEVYQSTSNHNTHDDASVEEYRRRWAHLPRNGPAHQRGLAYWVRVGGLLYVSLHQPDPRSGQCMQTGIDADEQAWLEGVLGSNSDAHTIIVAGHYPVFPVNGYSQSPLWCFVPESRSKFWNILVRHRVTAYLGSHVIAFDTQVHEGVLQITTGGAGTQFGPGGFMPGPEEYLHAVQFAAAPDRLRYRVIDDTGSERERLTWPLPPTESEQWVDAEDVSPLEAEDLLYIRLTEADDAPSRYYDGTLPAPNTIFEAWAVSEDGRLRIGRDAQTSRLNVRIHFDDIGEQIWFGPEIDHSLPNRYEIAVHPGMGPGGVLYRFTGEARWSSMSSVTARAPQIPPTTGLRTLVPKLDVASQRGRR